MPSTRYIFFECSLVDSDLKWQKIMERLKWTNNIPNADGINLLFRYLMHLHSGIYHYHYYLLIRMRFVEYPGMRRVWMGAGRRVCVRASKPGTTRRGAARQTSWPHDVHSALSRVSSRYLCTPLFIGLLYRNVHLTLSTSVTSVYLFIKVFLKFPPNLFQFNK